MKNTTYVQPQIDFLMLDEKDVITTSPSADLPEIPI